MRSMTSKMEELMKELDAIKKIVQLNNSYNMRSFNTLKEELKDEYKLMMTVKDDITEIRRGKAGAE